MVTKRTRCGQAMVEFVIGISALVLMLTAIVEFAPVFLKDFELQAQARTDAGVAALTSGFGSRAAGNGGQIAQLAQPKPEDLGTKESPWLYPSQVLPNTTHFDGWRQGNLTAAQLTYGVAEREFNYRLFYAGEALVDDRGSLKAQVYMPAMAGLGAGGE